MIMLGVLQRDVDDAPELAWYLKSMILYLPQINEPLDAYLP